VLASVVGLGMKAVRKWREWQVRREQRKQAQWEEVEMRGEEVEST
jgi:hypothetical protein